MVFIQFMEHIGEVRQESPNLILVLEQLDNEALLTGQYLFEEQVDEGRLQNSNPSAEYLCQTISRILKLRFLLWLLLDVAGNHLSQVVEDLVFGQLLVILCLNTTVPHCSTRVAAISFFSARHLFLAAISLDCPCRPPSLCWLIWCLIGSLVLLRLSMIFVYLELSRNFLFYLDFQLVYLLHIFPLHPGYCLSSAIIRPPTSLVPYPWVDNLQSYFNSSYYSE